MSDQIFIIISVGLLGLVIGALIMYLVSSKSTDSTNNVKKVEDKLNKYQEDVVQHFEQTADLVDELTQSYKKVFDHLGKSAKELLTDEQLQQQIEKRVGKKVTLAYLVDDSENSLDAEDTDLAEDDEIADNVEDAVDEVSELDEPNIDEISDADSSESEKGIIAEEGESKKDPD